MTGHRKIGELLLEEGLINRDMISKVVEEQRDMTKRFGEILVTHRWVSETDVLRTLSKQYGIDFVDVHKLKVTTEALMLIPERMAKRHAMLPVRVEKRQLVLVISDPLNVECIREAEFYTGMKIHPVLGLRKTVLEGIEYYYRFHRPVMDISNQVYNGSGGEYMNGISDIDKGEVSAPVIRLVNLLLTEAIERRASDIHIEPASDCLIIRFRIDGVLVERTRFNKYLYPSIISRLKILSKLNIAERRLPQDGGFRIKIKGKEIDIRISSLPVIHGEKMVIRILDRINTDISLKEIGLLEKEYALMERLAEKRKGIILVTGPTGSGKTTTLYGLINRIKSESINIVTVEDPVEYNIKGVNQVQVKPEIGLTFAKCLRSILRQDPDVIMVGEIRDMETAEMAFRAALTGHLVLSTLHTGDGASTITRLIDIGIPPYIIASTVIGIIAQRLVRTLCNRCKKKLEDSIFKPAGCYVCNHTGYYGRTGIFELFIVTERIRNLIVKGYREEPLRHKASQEGIRNLMDDAMEKIRMGLTTPEEVYRVIEHA